MPPTRFPQGTLRGTPALEKKEESASAKKPNPAAFSGWSTLIGLMIVYASLCGTITYAYGVFLPVMSETFSWSRSSLSGPYSLFFLIGGLLGPAAGSAVARWGGRRTIVWSGLVSAAGLLGMSRIHSLWQAYCFFGILCGLGIAFGEFIPITTVINHWFVRKRSLAMGFLFSSGGIGGFILPPLVSRFITLMGWRWTWIFLAGLHFLSTVVVGGLLIRSRPEALGQFPDGIPPATHSTPEGGGGEGRVYQGDVEWTCSEALTSPVLWRIIFIFSVTLFASAMLTTHLVAYLQDLRFSPFISASALGSMIGTSILGRLICGLLGLRFEARHLAAFFLGMMGLGLLVLLPARSLWHVYLYSFLIGIGFGGLIVLMPNWISACFGRQDYSRIIGWTSPVVTVISAGSPLLTGWLFEATGSYRVPFALSTLLIWGGVVVAFCTRSPKKGRSFSIFFNPRC